MIAYGLTSLTSDVERLCGAQLNTYTSAVHNIKIWQRHTSQAQGKRNPTNKEH